MKRFFYQKGSFILRPARILRRKPCALGIFKFAEFRYAPQDTLPGCDTLNVRMNATFDLPYDGELEFNVTTKSTDHWSGVISALLNNFNAYSRHAFFPVERVIRTADEFYGGWGQFEIEFIRAGTSFSLEHPCLVLPWMSKKMMRSRFPQHTSFKLYASQLNRARFFKMLSSADVFI